MDCKEYLKSYRTLRLSIARLETRIEAEESQAERATAILTGMPSGSGDKFTDDLWAALADTKAIYKEKLREALRLQREIEEFIACVPGEMNQLILQLRYVECLTWPGLGDRLGYNMRTVQKMHGRALGEARKIYEGGRVK